MRARALALLALSALVLPSCRDDARAELEASPASPDGSAPETMPSARRPARRFYLGRTHERCELYMVEEDRISSPSPTPCPLEILPGERIRLAGKTCLREGSTPERREPVPCPAPLLEHERINSKR